MSGGFSGAIELRASATPIETVPRRLKTAACTRQTSPRLWLQQPVAAKPVGNLFPAISARCIDYARLAARVVPEDIRLPSAAH